MAATCASVSGNIIPSARFSKVAANIASIYPLPNSQGNPITNVNNYSTVGGGGTNEHQIVNKLDHNLNSRWKLFGTFSRIWADTVQQRSARIQGQSNPASDLRPYSRDCGCERCVQPGPDRRVPHRVRPLTTVPAFPTRSASTSRLSDFQRRSPTRLRSSHFRHSTSRVWWRWAAPLPPE